MSGSPFHVALDVAYDGDWAFCAGVVFEHWEDATAAAIVTSVAYDTAGYAPGRFYLRELPSLERTIARLDREIATVVIDGYVTLDADRRPGLGFHLWERLDRAVAVIGVAKTRLGGTPEEAALLRGRNSQRPLYITVAGIDLDEAKDLIGRMHGAYRIPTLLKLANTIAQADSQSND